MESSARLPTYEASNSLTSPSVRLLVLAQITGSATTGAVRADYFWGWGDEALDQAGRMRQPLRAWALWPQADDGP